MYDNFDMMSVLWTHFLKRTLLAGETNGQTCNVCVQSDGPRGLFPIFDATHDFALPQTPCRKHVPLSCLNQSGFAHDSSDQFKAPREEVVCLLCWPRRYDGNYKWMTTDKPDTTRARFISRETTGQSVSPGM